MTTLIFLLKAACGCALSAESRLQRFRPTRERRDFRAFSPLDKRRDFCPLLFRCPALILLLSLATGCVSRPPTVAHVHIGHALTGVHVTPEKKGYFVVAEERSQEVYQLASRAAASSNLGDIKTEIARVVVASNSDEEFGVKHALIMSSNHLSFAATSPDASMNLQQSAPSFAADIARVVERCELIALLGKDIAASDSSDEAKVLAHEIQALADANIKGDDGNKDGRVGSAPAEFGLLQLRSEIDGIVAREHPRYRTVDQWYLFNLVRLPNGRWVFDQLGRGGNIEGYK